MKEISVQVMEQIGFDNATFSIEFFCHPVSGQACLLEINPRHSQSHAELFEFVDGVANHHNMVQLGLGRDPGERRHRGDYQIAGKWYYRHFEDVVVTRIPSDGEIATLQAETPGVKIQVVPEAGDRLSELPGQDSYSYELAHLFVAAQTEREMEQKYRRCAHRRIVSRGIGSPGPAKRSGKSDCPWNPRSRSASSPASGRPTAPRPTFRTTSGRKPVAMVAVRLSDVAPDGRATRVTYGLLNLTHRDGHDEPEPLEPGKPYRVRRVCAPRPSA